MIILKARRLRGSSLFRRTSADDESHFSLIPESGTWADWWKILEGRIELNLSKDLSFFLPSFLSIKFSNICREGEDSITYSALPTIFFSVVF